jgi:hypothetical protein
VTASLNGASKGQIQALRGAYTSSGVKGFLRTRLAFLEAEARVEYVPPLAFARAHAVLGEANEALDWIERGLEQRDSGLEQLRVDPAYDSVRNQRRFQDAVRRAGLS